MDSEVDAKYEFNAPKFIDFLQGDVDENTDKWFDERDGDEGGIDIDLVPYYEKELSKNAYKNATAAISAALQTNFQSNDVTEHVEQNEKQEKNNVEMENYKDGSSSMILNNDDASKNIETKQEKPDTLIQPENIKEEQMSCLLTPVIGSSTTTVSNLQNDQSDTDVPAKFPPRKSNIRTTWNSPAADGSNSETNMLIRRKQPLRSSVNKINYNESKKRKKTLSQSDETTLVKKSKLESLTKPETPLFVRKLRERGIKRSQPTEILQLKQIRELQRQTRAQVKQNDKNMRHALKAMSYQPVRSFNVTKTKEFHFATDQRSKEHPMQTRSDVLKPFETQLRQHPSSPNSKKSSTKPKPFNFLLADKTSAPSHKWESMAQFAMNFQTKTPDRFRMKPKKHETNIEKEKLQITHPKTPNLVTKTRSRPVAVESAEEREAKEAEAIKNYHFKATEFNPKIVEMQGMYGVKQMPDVSTTQVKPFNFEIESRIQQRKEKEEANKQSERSASAKSNVNTSLPTKVERLRNTELKPFSFESKDKERYQKKEEKIRSVIQQEKEMHEFHARPLPSSSPDPLPPVIVKPPTQPEPFDISSGSHTYQEKFKNKLQSELDQEKANRLFKAQSADVVKNKPFKPHIGIIPPTYPNEIVLNSEIRAKERAEYDQWKHEQEQEMEMEKLRMQKEKEKEEERTLKQLRKDAVTKANPVRHYKPVEIHKSTKSLTKPETPNLECKKRALMRL